jgi:hypothetical protein
MKIYGEWRYSSTILDLGMNAGGRLASRTGRVTPGEIVTGFPSK